MTRAERRHINKTKARRKKQIIKDAHGDWINNDVPFASKRVERAVKSDNYWSKHQVGCSCDMCKYEKHRNIPKRQEQRANEDADLQTKFIK